MEGRVAGSGKMQGWSESVGRMEQEMQGWMEGWNDERIKG